MDWEAAIYTEEISFILRRKSDLSHLHAHPKDGPSWMLLNNTETCINIIFSHVLWPSESVHGVFLCRPCLWFSTFFWSCHICCNLCSCICRLQQRGYRLSFTSTVSRTWTWYTWSSDVQFLTVMRVHLYFTQGFLMVCFIVVNKFCFFPSFFRFRCTWFPVWASGRPEIGHWLCPGQKERQTAWSHSVCGLWFGVWQGKNITNTLICWSNTTGGWKSHIKSYLKSCMYVCVCV